METMDKDASAVGSPTSLGDNSLHIERARGIAYDRGSITSFSTCEVLLPGPEHHTAFLTFASALPVIGGRSYAQPGVKGAWNFMQAFLDLVPPTLEEIGAYVQTLCRPFVELLFGGNHYEVTPEMLETPTGPLNPAYGYEFIAGAQRMVGMEPVQRLIEETVRRDNRETKVRSRCRFVSIFIFDLLNRYVVTRAREIFSDASFGMASDLAEQILKAVEDSDFLMVAELAQQAEENKKELETRKANLEPYVSIDQAVEHLQDFLFTLRDAARDFEAQGFSFVLLS